MDENIAQQILDEMLPYFEALETRSAAILQFLKDEGIATEEKLVPYLEQAGKTSDVKWRAARIRLSGLIASAAKAAENKPEKESSTDQTAEASSDINPEQSQAEESEHPKNTADQPDLRKNAGPVAQPARDARDSDAQDNRHQPKDGKAVSDEPVKKKTA